MTSLFHLTRKVALITGGTSGIGTRQAYALSGAGAAVILLGRREDRLQKICEDLRGLGRQADYVKADLVQQAELDSIVQRCLSFHDHMDILCNTAGVNLRQHADDVTVEKLGPNSGLEFEDSLFLSPEASAHYAQTRLGENH